MRREFSEFLPGSSAKKMNEAVSNEKKKGELREVNVEGNNKVAVNIENIEFLELDPDIQRIFELAIEQHSKLDDVEVCRISPDDDPGQIGYFNLLGRDKDKLRPVVFVMPGEIEAVNRLMNTRKYPVARAAELLGINENEMTPELLEKFIIAHELGHSVDCLENYIGNSTLDREEAMNNWDLERESGYDSLPVANFAPGRLVELFKLYESVDSFLDEHLYVKENLKEMGIFEVDSFEELLRIQEEEYRKMPRENFADQFAADFLIRNAEELGIKLLM